MISVGDIFDGKVVSVMPFGAFVEFGENQSGLVHISEVSTTYVKDINEHIKKGDSVKVKVIKIEDSGKISLSIKQTMEKPIPTQKPREKRAQRENAPKQPIRPADIDWSQKDDNLSFEDKLSKFKTDSDEAFRILKRNAASKRSGGYSRKGNYSFWFYNIELVRDCWMHITTILLIYKIKYIRYAKLTTRTDAGNFA